MGHNMSAYRDIEAEPRDKKEIFEKFKDESRPVRQMMVTTEEMDDARIDRRLRDYCAHLFIDYLKCKRDWFPEMYKCSDVLHQYKHCTVNDIKHNMMEYERTKRLMAREKRKLEREEREMSD